MASPEFYSKLKTLHDFISQKEQERFLLENQLEAHLHSDKRLSSVRVTKLKAYWQRINENAKKSYARNEEILQDLARVESCVSTLSSRTDRLKLVKEQCERKVDAMYPGWREKLREKIRNKQRIVESVTQRNTISLHRSVELDAQSFGSNRPAFATAASTVLQDTYQGPPVQYQGSMLQNTFERSAHKNQGYAQQNSYQESGPQNQWSAQQYQGSAQRSTYQEYARQNTYQGYEGSISSAQDYSETNDRPVRDMDGVPFLRPDTDGILPSNQKMRMKSFQELKSQTLEISSSLQEEEPQEQQARNAANDNYEIPSVIRQKVGSHEGNVALLTDTPKKMEPVTSRTEPFSSSDESSASPSSIQESKQRNEEDFCSEEKLQAQKVVEEVPNKELTSVAQSASSKPVDKGLLEEGRNTSGGFIVKYSNERMDSPAADKPIDNLSESSEEFGSETSLPLTADKNEPPSKSLSTKCPQLTTEGFWHLVKTLETSVDAGKGSPRQLYNTNTKCGTALKTDIISKANTKSAIFTFDLCTMSAIIIEELPGLVAKLTKGYLLSDHVLLPGKSVHEIDIRSLLATSDLGFWDQLLSHMVFLVKKGGLILRNVAEVFAPLIISKNSDKKETAIEVLYQILEEAVEEPTLDDSSVTQTSPGQKTPKPGLKTPSSSQSSPGEKSKPVPGLNLNDLQQSDSESEMASTTDRSFQKTPDYKLKESNAYRQMLQRAQSLPDDGEKDQDGGPSIQDEISDDSDSDDEIERAARVTPDSARSSGGRQRKSVLSSLSNPGSLSQHESKANETGNLQIPETEAAKNSVSERSDISSPSPTPREGDGYVPSIIDQSLKSSGRKSDTLQRSAAFWGDSDDDESEMSVPMGTSKSNEHEKDDFDFYD